MLQWLRNFTQQWDDVFPYVIRFAASVVMAMATVALFTRAQFVTNWIYEDIWSVLQAVTLDLLFFTVVTLFLRGVVRKQASWPLGVLSVALVLVATVVTGLTGYQMSMNIGDSNVALAAFDIPGQVFMLLRQLFAVASFVTVQYVIVLREYQFESPAGVISANTVTLATDEVKPFKDNTVTEKQHPDLKLLQKRNKRSNTPSQYDKVISLHTQHPDLTVQELAQQSNTTQANVRTYLSRYRNKTKELAQ